MTLISMDRFGQRAMAGAIDEVILGWPLPSESSLVGLDAQIHVIANSAVAFQNVVAYGLDAYVIPLLDPDAHADLDTIWDQQVPKSTSDISYELAETADTEPVWEPGDVVSEFFLGFSLTQPEEIYSRRTWLSMASHPNGTYDRAAANWFPMDFQKINVDKKYYVDTESAILIGASNPAMDNDVNDAELLPGAQTYEWILMKYIDRTQEEMIDWQTGLWSEGTGTFGLDEAENFLEQLVADWNLVDTAARFAQMSADFTGIGNARIRVPGSRKVGVIAPGN